MIAAKIFVFLLETWTCSGFSCINRAYQVYDTQAQCDVALVRWENQGGFFTKNGGLCHGREMTQTEIDTYRSAFK